jgi:hypothetical protein
MHKVGYAMVNSGSESLDHQIAALKTRPSKGEPIEFPAFRSLHPWPPCFNNEGLPGH